MRLKKNHAVFTLNDNVKHKNRSKQHVSSIVLQRKFEISFLTRLSVSSFSCLDLFFCLSFLRKTNKQTNTEKNIPLHQEQMYPLHELLTQLHKLKIYAHEMCTRNKIYKRRAFLCSQRELKLLTK